jgi:hypothetical protein
LHGAIVAPEPIDDLRLSGRPTTPEESEERALRDPDHPPRAEAGRWNLARVDETPHFLDPDPKCRGRLTRGEHRGQVLEVAYEASGGGFRRLSLVN